MRNSLPSALFILSWVGGCILCMLCMLRMLRMLRTLRMLSMSCMSHMSRVSHMSHIEFRNITQILSFRKQTFLKVRFLLDQKTAESLYKTTIQPIFDYNEFLYITTRPPAVPDIYGSGHINGPYIRHGVYISCD